MEENENTDAGDLKKAKKELEKAKKDWEKAKKELLKIQKDNELARLREEVAKVTYEKLGGAVDKGGNVSKGKNELTDLTGVRERLEKLLEEYRIYDDKRREIEDKFNAEYTVLEASRTPQNSAQITASQEGVQVRKEQALTQLDAESVDYESEFKTLVNAITSITLEKLGAGMEIVLAEFDSMEFSGQGGEKITKARQAVVSVKKNLEQPKKETKQELSPGEKTIKDWNALKSTLSGTSKTFKEIGKNVGGLTGEIMSAAGDITDSSISMVDGILTLANWGVQGTMVASKGASQAIQSVEKASVILAIISAAIQVATKIASLFTGKSKSQEDTERLKGVTDKVAQTNGVINDLIGKRVGLIKKATAAEKGYWAQLTQTSIDVQQAQLEKQFQSLVNNDFLAKKGKNNNKSLQDLGITSMKGLKDFMSSNELLAYLNEEGYSVRNMSDWQSLVDTWDNLEGHAVDLKATLDESLTGLSFDEAKDGLDSLLLDADTTMNDVAGNFEGYMKNAILSVVKTNILTTGLQDWYEKFARAMDDGKLDKDDVENLKKEYEDIYTEAQKEIDSMLEVAGLNTSPKQTATSAGFETMSQSTGNELNGRFTALQASGEETRQQNIQQTALISMQVDIAGQVRDISIQSMWHLHNINKNTASTVRVLQEETNGILKEVRDKL